MVPRSQSGGAARAHQRRQREQRAAAEAAAAAAASAARQRQIEADAKAKIEALAAEQARLAEEKAKAEFDAQVLAEDIQIQEKSRSKNAMANDTLARMNQRQAADDAQKTESRKGVIDSGGRGVGPAYDIKKQREAGQQKVGAAMSAAPGVSAFAGKANAVSPINATAQTANTGVMQGLNKSFDLGQLVADRANRDEAAASQFSGERSKAQNVGQANSFTPPNMQGIQIGETPIGKFGGS